MVFKVEFMSTWRGSPVSEKGKKFSGATGSTYFGRPRPVLVPEYLEVVIHLYQVCWFLRFLTNHSRAGLSDQRTWYILTRNLEESNVACRRVTTATVQKGNRSTWSHIGSKLAVVFLKLFS
jgi:hypothetical protein